MSRSLLLSTLCIWLALSGSGCISFTQRPLSKLKLFDAHPATSKKDADQYRQQWQTQRDGSAIRWLLKHQIHNGLTLEEVNARLGDTGVQEQQTEAFKKGNPGYLLDDQLYRYGPDKAGQTYYLAIRDGKVANFDPQAVK